MLALAIWFVTLVAVLDTYYRIQDSKEKKGA